MAKGVRTRARAVALAIAAASTAAAASFGCNAILGIEEQSARPVPDAAPDEAGDSAPPPVATDKCTTDSDCVPPSGCYTPHCDTVLGACAYTLCESAGRACAAGACDVSKGTCGAARDFGFRTTSYSVTDVALGCRTPDACVTAAFPYVFIGTKSNVVALRVDDVLATAATKVPVEDVTLRPAQLVASGRRVWILGEPQGTAPPYQLPIAWLDVPSDPTLPALKGTTTFVSYPFASAVGLPGPGGALFVVLNDAAQGLPAALLVPPLQGGAAMGVANPADASVTSPLPALPMFRVNAPAGSYVGGASAGRLVTYRGAGVVNLIAQAATSTAAMTTDVTLTPAFTPFLPARFASGPDGVALLGVPIVANPPADCDCTSAERMHWVTANATGNAESAQSINFETYRTPQVNGGACNQCNPSYVVASPLVAWVDAKTALVAAPASGNERAFTAVRALTRDPLAAPSKRRFVTTAADDPSGNFATDRVALAASGGFGYLILADSEGNKVTLSIVDPRCDAQ